MARYEGEFETSAEYVAGKMTAPTEHFEYIDLLRKAEHRLPTFTYTAEKCVGPSPAAVRFEELRFAKATPRA